MSAITRRLEKLEREKLPPAKLPRVENVDGTRAEVEARIAEIEAETPDAFIVTFHPYIGESIDAARARLNMAPMNTPAWDDPRVA